MRQLKYSTVLVTILVVLVVVVGVVTTLYLLRQPVAQTEITTPTKPAITTSQVATGFTQPTDIVSTKDDESLYIVEQTGVVKRVAPNETEVQVFMDIADKVTNDGEMGLLGLAFHPSYKTNGYLFVNYINKEQNTVIARYTAEDGIVDLSSEKVVLQVDQPFSNHKGGDLVFGQDGYLYASLGDGGSAGDPHNNAQNLNSLLGKILRIDIDTDQPYIVPADNPFAGRDDARGEIWSYGLRNPWRISFDADTQDLYIADVGQGSLEEINFQPASSRGGENYGWRCYEGTSEFNLEDCSGVNTHIAPVVEYDHNDGRCSVTGGYVYRGSQSALKGKYFYGDFCGSQLYYTERSDSTWQQTVALETDFAISTFGVDNSNELYFADYDGGNIYKIEAAS